MATHVVMRKFLDDNISSFLSVVSDQFDPWQTVSFTLYDGSSTVYFPFTITSDDLDESYKSSLEQIEAIKQACNAAMDELVDGYTRLKFSQDDEMLGLPEEEDYDFDPTDKYPEDDPDQDR